MKRILVILIAIFAFSLSTDAQLIRVNGYESILNPKGEEDIPADLKLIQYKKYLTKDYKPAYVDDFKQVAYLRYNIHEDQMEFTKDNQVYYLKKDIGRQVRFTNQSKYKIYGFKGEPQFFLVHEDGKNSLLARQIVKFSESQEPLSGYDRGKPADYKRRKDELYLALQNKGLVKVPTKKKIFHSIFGDHASTMKTYMKKNKLSYKKVDDLKKAVAHFNTL